MENKREESTSSPSSSSSEDGVGGPHPSCEPNLSAVPLVADTDAAATSSFRTNTVATSPPGASVADTTELSLTASSAASGSTARLAAAAASAVDRTSASAVVPTATSSAAEGPASIEEPAASYASSSSDRIQVDSLKTGGDVGKPPAAISSSDALPSLSSIGNAGDPETADPTVEGGAQPLRAQSSLLHHPRPTGPLPEADFGIHPSDAMKATANSSSLFSSSLSGSPTAAEAATTLERSAIPPVLPPAPWLWDSTLLETFVASSPPPSAHAPAELGIRKHTGTEREAAAGNSAAGGECHPSVPTAALFLLPTSGGSVLRLEEAYVCESCSAVRAPEELSVEIEAYYCPNCFDSLTQAEALACGCCCTKCFDCPRCYACLSVMRQPREAAAAAAGREIAAGIAASSVATATVSLDATAAGAASVANEAEAIVRRLLQGAATKNSTSEKCEEAGDDGVSAEDSALLAAMAPQRCESLLSLSSEEEEEEGGNSDPEEEGPVSVGGERSRRGNGGQKLSSPRRDDSSPRDGKQPGEEKKTQESQLKEQRYLYYFGCPYCRWNSQALQITSESSALLPAAAIAEERVGGLVQRYFHQVLDVLQRAARDRERLRQLEARVKHKAVALLFAAAAHDKRRVHAQQQQQHLPEQKVNAGASAVAAAGPEGGAPASAQGAGSLSGGNKSSWRVSDLEIALTQRAAQNSFARAGEAWAAAYRSDLQQPPQYVSLEQLLRGEHALLQQDGKEVMTDVLFGWQLQQHEAEQLRKRSRGAAAAREGAGSSDTSSSRDSATAQEYVLESAVEKRRSSIDMAVETPIAVPLHAPQLLLDRPSPDAPPLTLCTESLMPGSLTFGSSGTPAPGKSNRTATETSSGTADDEKAVEEWWTAENATLEQRLRNPNSLIAAATSTSLLRPTRKKLLTRESKRCRGCARYLVKAHVSSIAVPPFRVNNAAALLLPWIVPKISTGGKLLRHGDITDVQLNLLNPTDRPLRLRFYFTHHVSQVPVARIDLHGGRQKDRATRGFAAMQTGFKGHDSTTSKDSMRAGKNEEGEKVPPALGAADVATGSEDAPGALADEAPLTDESDALFITATEGAIEKLIDPVGDARARVKEGAAFSPTALLADWETMQIVTPDFELQLDRYDDMLGEFGDFDFSSISRGSSRGSSRGASRTDGFRSPLSSNAAVEWKKGNSAQVRLQVQTKEVSKLALREQQPAVCCLTLDVETAGLQSNTIRVQYLLFLGLISAIQGV